MSIQTAFSVKHELKTWPEFYEAIATGLKMFEVRKADRDFRVGDELLLKEYVPIDCIYTGRETRREITHILTGGRFGIKKGYCVLGLKELAPAKVYGCVCSCGPVATSKCRCVCHSVLGK